MIFGHRGVPEEYQENTMAGFKRAVELGLDGVELDVFLTKDNRLVVFHDLDVERLTGAKGLVPDMTWNQLKDLEIQVHRVVEVVIEHPRIAARLLDDPLDPGAVKPVPGKLRRGGIQQDGAGQGRIAGAGRSGQYVGFLVARHHRARHSTVTELYRNPH